MNVNFKKSFVFFGAGNLATHLASALQSSGHTILQIYSRTKESAKTLADKLNTNYTTDLNQITNTADIYVLALRDNVIEEILNKYDFTGKFAVHTSGSVNINIFKNHTKNYGVFYPLQTFSKLREVNFNNIPICIEANNKNNEKVLIQTGRQISNDVQLINSEQRKHLHIAAIFACNFVNNMYVISDEILRKNNISFDILKPLIIETAEKILKNKPIDVQTGPAVRNDQNLIKNHIDLLSYSPLFQKIYNFVSKNIKEIK